VKRAAINYNIAFVASTLPISIINRMAPDWNIGLLLLSRPALVDSYEYLKKYYPDIRIVSLPSSNLFNFVFIFIWLINSKLNNRHIYFFHECCCLYFDIILGILSIKGSFYPQVTLNSFEEKKIDALPLSKVKIFLKLFFLDKKFLPYKVDMDGGTLAYNIVWARKSYPPTIKLFTIEDSWRLRRPEKYEYKEGSPLRILLLVGSDIVESRALCVLYENIINLLKTLEVDCYIKDHPNRDSRLNLVVPGTFTIDPCLPIELVSLNFDWVIGTASTGMLMLEGKAISVLKLITSDNQELVNRRLSHLTALPNGHLLRIPTSIEQLVNIIISNG
jgi:hypothetical protein